MNSTLRIRVIPLLAFCLFSMLVLASCGSGETAHRERQALAQIAEAGCAHEAEPAARIACADTGCAHEEETHEEETDTHDAHAGHDHGEGGSDLDRSVAELFAASCEHGVPAHRCAECSYEVGIVAVSQELLDQGLVGTGAVDWREIREEIELTGEIQFDERRIAHLGPRVAGVVDRVMVDLGMSVEAGQVLLEIESAELAGVEAEFLEAMAKRDLAERAYDRLQELREANISSEREYLEAQQGLETATIQVNSRRQHLLRLGLSETEISRLERQGIEEATGRLAIRAPFAGEILELHAVTGERLEPETEIALLGDTHSLWAWADLYESKLAEVSDALAAGSVPARIFVNAFPDRQFKGHLDFLGRVMDESTRTVKARIFLENPDGLLRPGMFARIRLGLGAASRALVVPSGAVLSDEGRDFVFLRHDDDYFVRRPVAAIRESDGFVEIGSGLEAGQVVATAGAFLLKSDVLRSKMGAGCAD